VCYAVRILVVAPTRERRMQLRRAAVSAEWEVVGDAEDPEEAVAKATALRARFVVLDAGAAGSKSQETATWLASLQPRAFLVGVGDVPGADAHVATDGLSNLRDVLADLLHSSGDHTH
jgi:DNA-binding NarL/FixJ family response regulator